MTGNELISNLSLRLEDPAKSVFTEAAILEALNLAQRAVCNMVDNSYLVELQKVVNDAPTSTSTALPDTKYVTFDSLFGSGVNPLRNGIFGVFDETHDKWCTMIEPGEIKKLENSYLSGSDSNPVAYVFNDNLYIKPTTVASVDVWYLGAPTAIAANATECDLNIALQGVVLDFAEAQLWRMDAKAERGNVAYNNGITMVKTLNDRYQAEKLSGIGSKGR